MWDDRIAWGAWAGLWRLGCDGIDRGVGHMYGDPFSFLSRLGPLGPRLS